MLMSGEKAVNSNVSETSDSVCHFSDAVSAIVLGPVVRSHTSSSYISHAGVHPILSTKLALMGRVVVHSCLHPGVVSVKCGHIHLQVTEPHI